MKIKHGVRPAPVSFTELTLPSIITAAILALAGCSAGAGGGGNISVTIANKVTSVQAGTAAVSFSASVQNDSGNKGVTWSLTANGSSCSPTCGALSAATKTSVTYTPPASAGASPNNQPKLTATSVASTSKSDSDTFTVSPALTVTIANKVSTVNAGTEPFVVTATVQNDSTNSGVSWSLTANGSACSPACGTLSGSNTTSVTYAPPATTPSSPNNQPKLTATSIAKSSTSDFESFTLSQAAISVSILNKVTTVPADSGTILFSASVQNDSANAGITWTLKANGANCQPTCGTLATAAQNTIFYTPPTSVPSSPNNRPTLTATSVSNSTKSDSDAFTITAAASITVTINQVSSVLAGTAGTNFDAAVQNDSSDSGVTWTLTCPPSTNCGQLTGNTTTSVTYTPPATAPPSNQATIKATSIADNTKSASDTLTITSTVANGCSGASHGQESLLNGHYAFLVQGFEGSGAGTPILIGASFAANGSGSVTGGEEDVNDTVSAQHLTFTSSGSLYTVGSDHRGCLQLTNASGTTTVFHFAVSGITSGVASKGRIIEFDSSSSSGAGSRGSGILRLQTPSSFVLSALQANYAFGVDGWASNGNAFVHLTAGGSFDNSNGALSNGVDDINIDGFYSPNSPNHTGSIDPISATTGRTTASFDIFNWAVYVINPSELFLIGTDSFETSAGRAIVTANSFSATALSGNYILHATGNSSGSASVDLDLLTTTPGGAQTGALSGTVYSDGGGSSAATTSLSNVAYNIDPASGRVALGNPSDNLPVLYVTTPTDGISAFVVGVNADAQQGVIEFQPSQTYTAASAAGTYAFGSEDPGDNTVYNDAGSATITSGGSASGTADLSSAAGLTPNLPFSATVTISNSNGTGNLGSQTVAIINGTKIFYIDESTGVIVVAEQ